MLAGPFLVGVHGGWQGGEEPFGSDFAGQAEGLQPGQQILLDPGEREDGPCAGEFFAEGVHRLQGSKATSTLTCGTRYAATVIPAIRFPRSHARG